MRTRATETEISVNKSVIQAACDAHIGEVQPFNTNRGRIGWLPKLAYIKLIIDLSILQLRPVDVGPGLCPAGTILLEQLLRLCLLSHDFCRHRLATLVFIPAHLIQMYLIRSIRQSKRTNSCPQIRQRSILADACATKGLDGPVNDSKCHLGNQDLGLSNLGQSGLGAKLVHLDGSIQHDKPRGIDFDARPGNPLENHTVFPEFLSKRRLLGVVDSHQHPFESAFGSADAAHGVVDAARSETSLDDLEASPFSEDHVAGRNPDIVEGDVSVAVGGIIVAVDREHAVDGDTRGVGGNNHDRLLPVSVLVVGIALAQNDVDLASWVAGTARPPFLERISLATRTRSGSLSMRLPYLSIENVLVPDLLNPHLDVPGVRGGDLRLGHQECRPDLAVHQRLQPLGLLGVVAILCQYLHVSGIWGRTVGRFGCGPRPSHPFGHQAIFEIREARGLLVVPLGEKEVPESQLLAPFLQVLND